MTRIDLLGWTVAAIALAGLSIPWFLWGTSAVVAGLPVWLWWHVGWLCLAAAAFWLFATRAWGIGIETPPDAADPAPGTADPVTDAADPVTDTVNSATGGSNSATDGTDPSSREPSSTTSGDADDGGDRR